MVEVKVNKVNDNPFYGLRNCLALYQNGSKGNVNPAILNACWDEVKDNKEKRQMFFALLFSIGDITARQHNIFQKNKVDSGGGANREAFHTIVKWMKQTNYKQYLKFMFARLFNEFVGFDVLLANRVVTTKKTKKVVKTYNSLQGTALEMNDLADYIVSIIKGNNPADKYFVAKFLTRPQISKRKGHKTLLPETRQIMRQREQFLKLVSTKAGFRFLQLPNHIEFHGYYEWRKQYIGDMESVLFSSKKILEFDKQQFLAWLEKLPASARYRVRCRLLDKDNKPKLKTVQPIGPKEGRRSAVLNTTSAWGELPAWFLEWEKFKENKQTEVRKLEEDLRQNVTRSVADTTELQAKLATAKKQAKVTTGAVNFADIFGSIVTGTVDKIKVQPFLDKINLNYNTLVFMDDSGSMGQQYGSNYPFSAYDFACFMATICLMRNPEDTGRSLVGLFSSSARLYSTMAQKTEFSNRILRGTTKTIPGSEPLIVPELHFLDNLQRMRQFLMAMRTGNGTNISSIPDYIYKQTSQDPTMLEHLMQFPVWTIISDGNWNNMSSPETSINDMMMKCQRYFGYKPFIIAIDVARDSAALAERFQGIENFMYIAPNPAQIEQLLTNFKDMDIMDVYTPLQSFHRSNRYDLIKANTL